MKTKVTYIFKLIKTKINRDTERGLFLVLSGFDEVKMPQLPLGWGLIHFPVSAPVFSVNICFYCLHTAASLSIPDVQQVCAFRAQQSSTHVLSIPAILEKGLIREQILTFKNNLSHWDKLSHAKMYAQAHKQHAFHVAGNRPPCPCSSLMKAIQSSLHSAHLHFLELAALYISMATYDDVIEKTQ